MLDSLGGNSLYYARYKLRNRGPFQQPQVCLRPPASQLVKHPNIRIRIFVCRAPVFGFGFGFFCLYLDSDSDLRRVSVSRIRSDYLVSAAHIRYSYLFIWFWRVFVSRSRPDYLVSAAHIRYSYLFIILSAQIQ